MSDYLQATEWINFNDPRVARKAHGLTASRTTGRDKVRAIAEFVREQVELEISRKPLGVRASEVLCFGHGSATGKAILFSALCRASGLPCRLRLQRLSGAPERWTSLGKLTKLEWSDAHPVNEVYVDEHWVVIDVSLDSRIASRVGVMMPYIDGTHDATLGEVIGWVEERKLSIGEDLGVAEEIPLELLRLTMS